MSTESTAVAFQTSRSRTAVAVGVLVSVVMIARFPVWRVPGWLAFARGAPEPATLTWKLTQVVLAVLATMAILRVRGRGALEALGLLRPLAPAVLLGAICSLPILGVALWVGAGANPHATAWGALRAAVGSGLGEEVLYRGLFFLVLYRYARWPFWAAAIANSGPWIVGHLYQASETGLSLLAGSAEVAVTFAVFGALAAWMLVSWDDNLWILVTLHGLGNLWWYLFAENAEKTVPLYGIGAWVMRVGLIATAVALTLLRHRLPRVLAPRRR